MKNWTIGKRIIFGFVAISLIAASIGVFAFIQLRNINAFSSKITSESLPGMYLAGQLAEKIEIYGHRNDTLVLKNLLSQDDDQKKKFDAQVQTNLVMLAQAAGEYGNSIHDPQELRLFKTIVAANDAHAAVIQKILKLSREDNAQEAMETRQSDLEPAFVNAIAAVRAAVDFNKTRVDAVGKQIQSAVVSANSAIGISLLCLIAAASAI